MGARGKRLLGVRGCVYVVFKVLHGLWRLVWLLVSGEGCGVWLKYLSMLIFLIKFTYSSFYVGGGPESCCAGRV